MILNFVAKSNGLTCIKSQDDTSFSVSSPRFSSTRKERDDACSQYEGGFPGARLILSQNQENESMDYKAMFWRIKMIVWDSEKCRFSLRTEKFWQYGTQQKRDSILSSELPYLSNCQLPEGYFIDHDAKRIILPNGSWIDGPTGKLYSVQGTPMSGEDRFQKEC
jgi:hypothetical protein